MNKKILVIGICLLVVLAVIGIFQWQSKYWGSEDAQNAFEQAALESSDETDMANYAAAVEDQITSGTPVSEPATSQTTGTTYAPRIVDGILTIGSPDAPVTITEFSSLSCPHCASFHANTLPALKADYIDTGKVQIAFVDFPLNQQALHATLLLKCVDAAQRYKLMELLFKQQAEWAFEGNHQTKLKQYAALLGLSSQKADQCMSDNAVEQQILTNMKAASMQYDISSTPTFAILPSKKIITGAAAYGTFSTEIEKILNQ